MTRKKLKAEHELDRTEILRYLNECGFQAVTPLSIRVYLDESMHPVSEEGIAFHLNYLRDRKWVEVGKERKVGEREEKILWARITADGVDEFDRRDRALGEKS